MLFMKKARFYVHCAWLKHISYRSNWIETQKSFSLSVNISLYSLVWELENFLFSSLSYDNTSKNFFARFHNIQLALTCSSVHITTCVAITLWKTYTIFCNAIVHWVGILHSIALFTVNFSHLHYNVFERGCEAISGRNSKIARNCLTSTFKHIVMQIRKVNCEKGYCSHIHEHTVTTLS